jgi:hypothetical protein
VFATSNSSELEIAIHAMKATLTTLQCREILGCSALGLTDQQIDDLRDELHCLANVLYEQIVKTGREGLEAARWSTHLRLTGEGE